MKRIPNLFSNESGRFVEAVKEKKETLINDLQITQHNMRDFSVANLDLKWLSVVPEQLIIERENKIYIGATPKKFTETDSKLPVLWACITGYEGPIDEPDDPVYFSPLVVPVTWLNSIKVYPSLRAKLFRVSSRAHIERRILANPVESRILWQLVDKDYNFYDVTPSNFLRAMKALWPGSPADEVTNYRAADNRDMINEIRNRIQRDRAGTRAHVIAAERRAYNALDIANNNARNNALDIANDHARDNARFIDGTYQRLERERHAQQLTDAMHTTRTVREIEQIMDGWRLPENMNENELIRALRMYRDHLTEERENRNEDETGE